MPTRQQRGQRWRGRVAFEQIAVANDVVWQPLAVVGAVLTIELSQINASWFLKGIPQIQETDTNTFPISAAFASPTTVDLTYAAPLAAALDFVSVNRDPALRSTLGGFLAPARHGWPTSGPTIPAVAASTAISDGTFTDALCRVQNGVAYVKLPAAPVVGQRQSFFVESAFAGSCDVQDDGGTVQGTVEPSKGLIAQWNGATWDIATVGP